jgi:two-component system, OmpR family, sensor histidine kinase MprB
MSPLRRRNPLRNATANMSFRRRITLVSATAVAVAVVVASALTYLLASHQLRKQVDEQLRNRSGGLRFIANTVSDGSSAGNEHYLAGALTSSARSKLLAAGKKEGTLGLLVAPRVPGSSTGGRGLGPASRGPIVALQGNPFGNLSPHPDQVRGYQQLIDSSGKILFRSSPNLSLPVDAASRRLASKSGKPFYRDAHASGIHLRVLTDALRPGYAVQLAQPLTGIDRLLRHLRVILTLLDVGGIALAALLGRLVAGAAVAPVKRLTQATEHVTLTQDLSKRIEPAGVDEIGRLAESFNAMLDALQSSMRALDASVHAQRQLVADASHELRTPVTSLRTNIEILKQERDMGIEERHRVLEEAVEQIEELTLLMNDLIELARGEQPRAGTEDVRLDLVVEEAAERTRRHSPDTPLHVELDPVVLAGEARRLARAVNNLIDNAVNYSPNGSPVEVSLHGDELTVRDHGPGISSTDLPHVFDRFYRGVEARSRPGSGLGLAIVRQVAEQHGGSVEAERPSGGGTLMRLRLPGAGPVEPLPVLDPALHATS